MKFLVTLTAVVAAMMCAVLRAQDEDAGDGGWKEKVAPMVQRSMGKDQKTPCILLGKTQLIEMSSTGYADFCKANAKAKRLELRREVIAKLKAIAAKEQKPVLELLGNPADAKAMWIVNAVRIDLADDQIRKVAASDLVKYVYGGFKPNNRPPLGKVAEVLKPAQREPFALDEEKKLPWNLKRIRAVDVWNELKVHGEGVTVAMLDMGVNYRHEDLRQNVWINEGEVANNGKDDDGNGYIDDLYGYDFARMTCQVLPQRGHHGTWTSGIVAGDGTGGTYTGLAPRAKIMVLIGSGFYNQAAATQYAIENGADVMNMSFSVPNLGQHRGFWRLMAEQAGCAGLVMVSGAGNFGRPGTRQFAPIPVQIRIPEGIPNVICAGGLNEDLQRYTMLSCGPVEWASVKFYGDFPYEHGNPEKPGLVKPDVCGFSGPKYPVLSDKDMGYIDPNERIMGNSFSSPHVTGTVALMLSAAPQTTAWRVKEILEQTAQDVGDPGKDTTSGAGLVDALKATKQAIATSIAK